MDEVSELVQINIGFNHWNRGGVYGLQVLHEVPLGEALAQLMHLVDHLLAVDNVKPGDSHVHVTALQG